MIHVTAFRWVPPFAQGLVRDLRVRWALEEAGVPYRETLIDHEFKKSGDYKRKQPFGQVPVLEDEGLTLFESGAIALYIAEKSKTLWPEDAAGQARARTWVFAALNSVEPSISNLASIDLFHANEEWARLRRPVALELVHSRLKDLAAWLEGKEYLENRFTVGDLMMTTVLRNLRHIGLVSEYPALKAFQTRCEDRPAFKRALAAQMTTFENNPPPKK